MTPASVAQFALGEPVALPQDTQEGPVAERNLVIGEPELKLRTSRAGVLDQMREPVVRHRLAPVPQDRAVSGACAFIARHLMWKRDLAALACGAKHRETDFQASPYPRGRRAGARGRARPPHRIRRSLPRAARTAAAAPPAATASLVDDDAVGQRPQVGALATHDDVPEMLMREACAAGGCYALPP